VNYELELRNTILDRLASDHAYVLATVRTHLYGLAQLKGTVTADDARTWLAEHGIAPGNWLGSLFRTPEWECVGFTESKTPGRHASAIRVWRLHDR